MADSIYLNGGRSCINASGVWASRHTAEIAEALAKKLGPIAPLPMTDPKAGLAAFTTAGVAAGVDGQIEEKLREPGCTEVTAQSRGGPRLVKHERCDYLRPTIFHVTNLDAFLANMEYMFPCASVVECPQDQMLKRIGQTLVCTAITQNEQWASQLVDATHIDRLNIGAIRTNQLHWMQPHEGNIIDFLFRARAYQNSPPPAH